MKAEEWDADLVVIGAGKHSFIERIKLGSVLRKVVGACERSVRVGRPSPGIPEPSVRIIIGLDGSPDAEFAMEAVAERVWPDGSASPFDYAYWMTGFHFLRRLLSRVWHVGRVQQIPLMIKHG